LSLFALPRAEEGPEEMIGSDKVEARGTDSSRLHPESLSGGSYQDSIAISVDENIPDTESNPWDIKYNSMTYDWDELKPQIIELYIRRNLTLDEVARTINIKNGLDIR
jgi:hypothetical protein